MRAPATPAATVSSLFGTVIRFASMLREAGERRRAVHSLASLDDHMLRDIGLTRFDVDAALVEPATTDATLILAERARDLHRHQRAMAQEAQAWAALMPEADGRGSQALLKRVA
jgi:uncharacterized protein YjiS (DUF1127 family)